MGDPYPEDEICRKVSRRREVLFFITSSTVIRRSAGKSLFVDTLRCAFAGSGDPSTGKKELFEGLYLLNKWNWEEVYPVVRIGLDTTFANKEDLEEYIREIQNKHARKYGIELRGKHIGTRMMELIEGIREKVGKKVVLLVDEYDKPIIDNVEIERRKEAVEIREVLKSFYQTIKGLDQHLKFVFITGISKFAKVSFFWGRGPGLWVKSVEGYKFE